jgi:hypothetical protein
VKHQGTLALVEGDWKLIEPGTGNKVNQNTHDLARTWEKQPTWRRNIRTKWAT